MMTGTPDTVTLVPINRIEILNSRDRNMKVFEEIVDNIRTIGLKKPITVAERPGDDGEERLIEGVQRGTIPLTTALEIARANENATEGDGQANLGDLLQEAYENGQLKGRQIIEAKRLIEKRMEHGPASPNRDQIKPPTSSYSLVRTYQREVERQRKMVLKAEHAHQRLLLVVQGLKKLFADEHFVNLLRAEGLDTLPKYLAERINTLGSVSTPDHPEPEGATL